MRFFVIADYRMYSIASRHDMQDELIYPAYHAGEAILRIM
jgi:hypothetical protein